MRYVYCIHSDDGMNILFNTKKSAENYLLKECGYKRYNINGYYKKPTTPGYYNNSDIYAYIIKQEVNN